MNTSLCLEPFDDPHNGQQGLYSGHLVHPMKIYGITFESMKTLHSAPDNPYGLLGQESMVTPFDASWVDV